MGLRQHSMLPKFSPANSCRIVILSTTWRFVVQCIILSWLCQCVGGTCTAQSSLVGFTADLSMGMHQLRGRITVLDDCTFKVENFDMLAGNEVFWWGAKGDSLMDMLAGVVVSPVPLDGGYGNDTLEVTLGNVSWEGISILGVWSKETATDYGHIKLQVAFDHPANANALTSAFDYPANANALTSDGARTTLPAMGSHELSSLPAPQSVEDTIPSSGIDSRPPWNGVETHSPGGSPLQDMRKGGVRQPTMFGSCLELSPGKVRLRWTVNFSDNTIDLGLEAAVPRSMYVAFGFADPAAVDQDLILRSDVAVAGYDAETPFVSDYYITDYKECQWQRNPPVGICPDSVLYSGNGENNSSDVDNVKLLYAHHKDGILFARYQRAIDSPDKDYDHSIDLAIEQSYVWAIGQLQPADGNTPITPMYPGRKKGIDYGSGTMMFGKSSEGCLGPLNASLSMQSSRRKTARRGFPLVITAGPSKDYPNPPASDQSLFIDGVETPILQVERGVEVMFSVEAGHDVPVYITSDPVGGKWNQSELILAGGQESSGVHTSPYIMRWTPDALTPNPVYYQSFTGKKMGWQFEILERGLPDMYQLRAWLSNEQVELFWTIQNDSIALAARSTQPCGYLAIGFGSGMVQSTVYVGWIENGVGNIQEYWIDGRTPANIHPVDEGLVAKKVARDSSSLTMEFERKLRLPKSRNTIDPQLPVKMIWAIGDVWTSGEITEDSYHKEKSESVSIVDLQLGVSKPEQLQPVFAVHGFMMFLAWGVLLPGGVMAARYLKALDTQWHPIHVYAQTTGIAIMFLGFVFALGEMKGLDLRTVHSKFGISAISLATWQPLNAWIRPRKPSAGEASTQTLRLIWQFVHMYSGRAALVLGGIALSSGLIALGEREEIEYVEDLRWALVGYLCLILVACAYYEYRLRQNRKRQRSNLEPRLSNWMQNSSRREDSTEDDRKRLLQGRWDTMLHHHSEDRDGRLGSSEIQIEAFNR